MKNTHVRLIVCTAVIMLFLAIATTVAFAATPEPIYISAIGGSDIVKPDTTAKTNEFPRYASANRLYLDKRSPDALTYDESTRTFTKFSLSTSAGNSLWYGFSSNKYYALSGPRTISIGGSNYSTYTTKGSALDALPTTNMVESGLYYTFENGVVTITGNVKKMSDGNDVPWVLPVPATGFSAVKEIIIEANIKNFSDHVFNGFNKVTKVTIPKSATSFSGECFARMSSLTTLLVSGSGITADGTADFRNVTYYASNAFQEAFQKATVYFFLNETACKSNNTNFCTSSAASKCTAYVYVPYGYEECTWITSAAPRCKSITSMPNPTCKMISELGYQVRTTEYNGLRGRFAFNKDGVNEGCTLIEAGVIVGKVNSSGNCGYKLSKNENGEYVISDPYVRKLVIDEEKAPDGFFNVTVVRYTSKAQMTAPVFMSGYEVWVDDLFGFEYIIYTAESDNHCAPASLYSATLGMYRDGLINSSINNGITFWEALEGNNLDLSHTVTDAARSTSAYPYSITADGAFADSENANAKVYVFEGADGKYTAIVRGSGTFYGGGRALNYVRENYLSEAYIGVPIDVLVIDEGITSVAEGAVSGFSDYVNESVGADFHTSLTTIIYARSVTDFTGQAFHSNFKMDAFVRFDPLKAASNPNYVDESRGTVDLSAFTQSILAADKFNRCKEIQTVILPVPTSSAALPARLFQSASKLSRVYVAGSDVPADKTADIGTLYTFNYSNESSSQVFSGNLINNVIAGANTYKRTSGNTWSRS